jgi:hypothetical protein
MSSLRTMLTALALTAIGSAAGAQQPTPAPNGPPVAGRQMGAGARVRAPRQPAMRPQRAPGGIAAMFLAHTGDLKLADQQVTRLAAIARRTTDRHAAMRASMDSAMRAGRPQPGQAGQRPLAPGQRGDMEQMRATMERMRQAERTDVRDALAVLTPDQLTDAWMLRGAGQRAAGGRPMMMRGPGPRR